MIIISISIGKCYQQNKNSIIYTTNYNLKDFNFFQKNTVKEACNFASKLCFDNLDKNNFNIIEYKGNFSYSMILNNNLGCCLIMNKGDYPVRIAKAILIECLTKFKELYPNPDNIKNILEFKEIDYIFDMYEYPSDFDKITQVQDKLDETKKVLYESIDKILERGEKIEDLVQKSDDLSYQSKLFFKQTKKMNRCCIIL
jgi:synaptobrevin family protein YKT6